MTLSFIYWFIILCWILFGSWWSFRPTGDRGFFGITLLIFILFVLLGLHDFGFPIRSG